MFAVILQKSSPLSDLKKTFDRKEIIGEKIEQ